MRKNEFNQPIGESLPNFSPGKRPQIDQLKGMYALVEPLDVKRHFADAYKVFGPNSPQEQWTYLSLNSFKDEASFRDYFIAIAQSSDPYYLAIIDRASGKLLGIFSLMRIDSTNRVVEMGWVLYGEQLKRSRIATEAQFLVMQYVFETLQYRRYEWKCDSLNFPSRNAAQRLGFQFEGIFRRATVYKGRSRDTAWFSMLAEEYVSMKPKFISWLDPANFNDVGQQIKALNDF